jgi:hypothetical protein
MKLNFGTCFNSNNKVRRFLVIFPVLLTLLLIIWTLAVFKFSKYGDWLGYPALLTFPAAFLWHIVLIAVEKPKWLFVLYAVIHLLLLFGIWLGCLMLITKGSI